MKKKSIISLFALLLGLGVSTTSCEDMLTPEMDRYAEGFNGRDTVNFYLGIVANVQEMIENNVILGEIRSDLTTPTEFVSDTVSKLANFEKVPDADNGLVNRAGYYKVINQCNFYLAAVDTLAQKNNNQYMCKEFAQVQFIRAWTYMQLVQLYGEVPFITLPVDNAGTGWEKNPHGGWVNADNLLEKLQENGLDLAYNYEQRMGWPSYGTFTTGANGVDINAKLLLFPGDVVMGDLYLLRGNGEADFLKAAEHYYIYLRDYASNITMPVASAQKRTLGDKDVYEHNAKPWTDNVFGAYDYNKASEWTTIIPSAANNSLGTTLMRTVQIYGFDPSSSTKTSMESASDGSSEEAVTTGEISVIANYKNRQIAPSQAYINLNKAQAYRFNEYEGEVLNKVVYPEDLGDARLQGSVQYLNTLGGRLPFVQKFAPASSNNEDNLSGFKFRYAQPVYRKRQIWLRYAEAINRAGFPRFAFAILRDGLNETTIPSVKRVKTPDDVNKKYVVSYELENIADGCYYLNMDEVTRADALLQMDFMESNGMKGIHELGCGESSDKDTLYTYGRMVGERIKAEATRTGSLTSELAAYADSLIATGANPFAYVQDDVTEEEEEEEEEGENEEIDRTNYPTDTIQVVTLDNPTVTLAREINAVESLIADEMALETAFEGSRYFDLLRIARHKNADVNFGAGTGTSWFAWLVSRRNMMLKPYESPEVKDDALYNRLMDPQNWYLQNPQY